MAKFTTNLSEPSMPSAAPAPVVEGSVVGDIARVAQTGLSVFANIKQQQQAQRGNETLAGIQTGILDLEDERNALLLEDQQLATQMQQITQDGITEDEQATIQALEKDRARLTDLRKRGVLNPLVFQTRLNALQKQALADVNNMAIQPQINQLFGQGRSRITAPISSAQAQFENTMDQKYGVGGWSGIDAGREKGKAIYLNQLRADAHNNFESFTGQEATAFMNIADDVVRQTRKALSERGALVDTDIELFRAGINSATQTMLINIDEAVQANREAGVPIDQALIKASRERVLETQKFYMAFLEKGQEFGDNVMLDQRLNTMNSIADAVNKARNPHLGQLSTAVAGTGTNGDLMALAQLVQAPEGLLTSVVQNLPENLRATMDVNTLKTQAAQAVAYAIDGVDFKELATAGLVNNRLAKTVAGVVFKRSDNDTTLDSFMSSFEEVDFSDVEGSLDLFNQPTTRNNLKSHPKGIQRMPAVATHLWDNIIDNMLPDEKEYVKLDEKGNVFLDLPEDAERTKKNHAIYINKLLGKFNEFMSNYPKEIGFSKEQFLQDVLPEGKEPEQKTRPKPKQESTPAVDLGRATGVKG